MLSEAQHGESDVTSVLCQFTDKSKNKNPIEAEEKNNNNMTIVDSQFM